MGQAVARRTLSRHRESVMRPKGRIAVVTGVAQGAGDDSIRYTHAVLRSALNQAVRWKLLLANPAELVDLPRHTRRNVGVLSAGQARTFMGAIAGHPYEALFALAMTTGMRPSEYLALTWADIDLVRGTVSVSRTLEWKKGGWQFADTKRSRSRRVIKLQAWVIGVLVKHRPVVGSQAVNGPAHNLVFLAKRGGPIRESKFVARYFKPLIREAGLPNIRLYDLRHTAATLGCHTGTGRRRVAEDHQRAAWARKRCLHTRCLFSRSAAHARCSRGKSRNVASQVKDRCEAATSRCRPHSSR